MLGQRFHLGAAANRAGSQILARPPEADALAWVPCGVHAGVFGLGGWSTLLANVFTLGLSAVDVLIVSCSPARGRCVCPGPLRSTRRCFRVGAGGVRCWPTFSPWGSLLALLSAYAACLAFLCKHACVWGCGVQHVFCFRWLAVADLVWPGYSCGAVPRQMRLPEAVPISGCEVRFCVFAFCVASHYALRI